MCPPLRRQKIMPTVSEVAEWMKAEFESGEMLYQNSAVYEIEERFGEEFVYYNENGNPAINRKVLAEFRKITPDAVWSKQGRYWRRREDYDEEGRSSY